MNYFFKSLFLLFLAAILAFNLGCREEEPPPPKPQAALVRVGPEQWPGLADDFDPASLSRALEQSRVYLRRLPPERKFEYGPDEYSAAHLLESLDRFEKLFQTLGPGPDLTEALAREFVLYRSIGSDGQGRVLCTGYYEPLLEGDLKPGPRFKHPLYRVPEDLIRLDLGRFSKDLTGKVITIRISGNEVRPYFTRHEIDRDGALAGRGLELAWVEDPVALFFLHIQGSGVIRLPDGELMGVGYAGANGRAYTSIGRYMLDNGLAEPGKMSLPIIRDFLKSRPDLAPEVMDVNESYVFFRKLEGETVGNINVPLTPRRSVALDYRIFPKGALVWLEVETPIAEGEQIGSWRNTRRFAMVQDTGGAIRGPGRLDLFFGGGPEAETEAGHMYRAGRLFFLVKKTEGGKGK